ncbi:hypothetical protein JAAARDRAFT_474408 [Jaapia argillacea MUCL 33604]|uniref:Uncharacterized protein n=1 Tax=Jaapia argillacea MUCL 33604 TaxID=933084 RepID=A0A067PQW0_9AGAM|nr:hypothetical protein JAAARDRAFT_474408 [Jaapia argillacea MUCL 33604]
MDGRLLLAYPFRQDGRGREIFGKNSKSQFTQMSPNPNPRLQHFPSQYATESIVAYTLKACNPIRKPHLLAQRRIRVTVHSSHSLHDLSLLPSAPVTGPLPEPIPSPPSNVRWPPHDH